MDSSGLLQVWPQHLPNFTPIVTYAPAMLQDSAPPAGRFRPYASARHRVTRGRYITSNDPRGYIPVYEYPLNGQWIMMDIDDGYILWTGIWKALGNAKADIVKMLESQPELAPQLRRVRGGYLKIQGTWMPYEVALRLARRVAWTIREDLIPLFGPTFPSTCLTPDQPGYGQILGNQHGRRRGRRTAVPLALTATLPPPQTSDFEPSPALGNTGQQAQQGLLPRSSAHNLTSSSTRELSSAHLAPPSQVAGPSGINRADQHDFNRSIRDPASDVQYPYPPAPFDRHASGLVEPRVHGNYSIGNVHGIYDMPPPPAPAITTRTGSSNTQASTSSLSVPGPIREHRRQSSSQALGPRFSPYASPAGERRRYSSSATSHLSGTPPMDLPPLAIPPSRARSASGFGSSFLRHRLVDTDNVGPTTSASNSAGTSTSISSSLGENIILPPIHAYDNSATSPSASRERSGSLRSTGSGSGYSLPPISSLDEPPSSLSTDSSPGRLDSTVVLKRLTLDDELLGRARQGNFADIPEERSVHGNEVDEHVQPTHEQLWTRRRSLSAPPLKSDIFPKTRSAWSAAPNIRLTIPSNTTQAEAGSRSSSSAYVRSPLSYDRRGGSPAEGGLGERGSRPFLDSPIDDRPSQYVDEPRGFMSMGRSILSPADTGVSRRGSRQSLNSHITSDDDRVQEANFPSSTSSPKNRQAGDLESSTSKSSGSTEKANGGRTPRQPVNYLPTDSPSSGSTPCITVNPLGSHSGSLDSSRRLSRTHIHSGSSVQLSADLASYRFGGESQMTPYRRSPSPYDRQKETEHLPMDMDVEPERTSYFHSSVRDGGTPSR